MILSPKNASRKGVLTLISPLLAYKMTLSFLLQLRVSYEYSNKINVYMAKFSTKYTHHLKCL